MSPASDTVLDPAREGTSPALAVIGTGYVGLTTGACLAHLGFHVVCADIDAGKVARLVHEFQDAGGRAHTLGDFKGKVVLLNLWATWCAPCREEMPALDRLQAALGGPRFEVVALSIDQQGPQIARKFYDEVGVKSLALYVDRSAQAAFKLGAVGLPSTLLVDARGREIGRHVGPAKWDSPEVLAELRRRIDAVEH